MAARSGGRVAADVGITSPSAMGAGDDCTIAMVNGKLSKYAPYLEELRAQGLAYVPLVWSSWGRPHEDAAGCMDWASKQTARLRGLADNAVIRRRWGAIVATEIWRRAVCMLRACMPRPGDLVGLIADGETD